MKLRILGSISALCVVALVSCGESESITPWKRNFKVQLSRSITQTNQLLGMYLTGDWLKNAGAALSLAGTTSQDWVIKVDGCQSLFEGTFTSTAAEPRDSLLLNAFDEGCQAGLFSFALNGKTYTKVGGGVLNGEAATQANFKDEVSGDELTVIVGTQLASPLTDASRAEFLYSNVRNTGISSTAENKITIGAGVSEFAAPNLEIYQRQVKWSALPGGVPHFVMKFECQLALTNGKCPTANGESQDISAMSVRVVPDIYPTDPTIPQAEAVFATEPGVPMVADQTIGTNGGGVAQPVVGPGRLLGFPNLMIFIRYQRNPVASYSAYRLRVPN